MFSLPGLLLQIVHRWIPCHRETAKRSHVDKTIALLQIGERYVPIVEAAIKVVTEDDDKDEEKAAAAAAAGDAGKEE